MPRIDIDINILINNLIFFFESSGIKRLLIKLIEYIIEINNTGIIIDILWFSISAVPIPPAEVR